MSSTGQLIRAEIVNVDTNAKVKCMFNPKQYTISKSNKWTERDAKGTNLPILEFSSGDPAALKLELLFDTNEAHSWFGNSAGEDVRNYTQGLWDMMMVNQQKKDPNTGRSEPPHCKFQWGSLWSFEAVITSLSQTFTLFKPDGTPVRATVSVDFKQVVDSTKLARQNPTSGGVTGERLRTICEGETLPGIAFEEYGDSNAWRYLADINNLDDPRRLRPGRMLLIKPLPPL